MKRRREAEEEEEEESEIWSAIEELSALVNTNDDAVRPIGSASGAAVAAAPASAMGSESAAAACGADFAGRASCSSVSLYIPARSFLRLCGLILQILDKIGPCLAVLRDDISQNIKKLEKWWKADPVTYSNLVEILKWEAVEGNARKNDSCSRALVWLTRSIDLTAVLMQKLSSDPAGQSMEVLVEDSYNLTLKPWHGWISATAYKVLRAIWHCLCFALFLVALKLLPDRKFFVDSLMTKGQDFNTLKDEIKTLNSLLMPFLKDVYAVLRSFGLDKLKSS